MKPPAGTTKIPKRRVKQERAGFIEEGVPSFTPAKESLFAVKDDIPPLSVQMGIHTNPNLMSINPLTIQQRNGVPVMGTEPSFNNSSFNLIPQDGMTTLTFVPTRLGTTFDPTQKDSLAIGSYTR